MPIKRTQRQIKKFSLAKKLPAKKSFVQICPEKLLWKFKFYRCLAVGLGVIVFSFSFLLFTFFERKSADLLATPSAQAQTQDAIAIRVMENPKHLSPERWYQENVPHPGNPQSAVIDGYQAVRDGRSVYVAAANLGDDNLLYANIYLISYTEGASAATQKIFDQLLANWNFNVNILSAGAGKVCSSDYTTNCEQDKDCPAGEKCLSIEPKPRLTRDVKRLADLQDVRKELEDYNYQAGFFPTLSAGTYLPRLSFSVWPSWQKTLGQALGGTLAQDPVNKFYGCNDPYDKTTCWDNQALAFACPANYYIYAYQSPTATGDQAKLYTELEYRDQNWASTLDILTNPQELLENCRLNFGQNTNDYDNDTVPNGVDNCPTIPNQAQTDSDGDKIGDVCDACPNDPQNDQDNDGYCVGLASLVFGDKKDQDNCPTVYNPSQEENPDISGVGLACSRCQDADQDSFCSYQTGGDDCDDTNPAVHPGAPEIPNGVDDNCDGRVDECPQVGLTQPCYTGPIGTEGVGICKSGLSTCKSLIWGPCAGEVTPKTEGCSTDNIDEDCGGGATPILANCSSCDADSDGYCTTDSDCAGANLCCSLGCGDENDNDPAIYPGAPELCDDKDNNQNGQIDEDCDDDNDDWCDANLTTIGVPAVCPNGTGDCNDNNSNVYPGATEICDSLDNDCNGLTDAADLSIQGDPGICADCIAGSWQMPSDDPACGIIDCDGRDVYQIDGTQAANNTSWCRFYDYNDLTANRCKALLDCKDANTIDCTNPTINTLATAGICKSIGQCNATSQTIVNYPDTTSCDAMGSECFGAICSKTERTSQCQAFTCNTIDSDHHHIMCPQGYSAFNLIDCGNGNNHGIYATYDYTFNNFGNVVTGCMDWEGSGNNGSECCQITCQSS